MRHDLSVYGLGIGWTRCYKIRLKVLPSISDGLAIKRRKRYSSYRRPIKLFSKVSQAAACDGNNYTTAAGEQNPTPSTLPIY